MVASDVTAARLLRYPPFLLYYTGHGCSEFSYQITAVAVGWQVYALTGSAFNLGLVGLVQFIPTALIRGAGCFRVAPGCRSRRSVTAGQFWLVGLVLTGAIALERAVAARSPPSLAQLFAGIGFVRRHPAILGTISLDLFAVLLGGATALLPIYARDILHTGPWGLGVLRGAPAVGALIMTFILGRYAIRRRAGDARRSRYHQCGDSRIVGAAGNAG
jgi:hypothetical protein